ncbi:MAG: hypothetical protein QXS38_00950 [Candidatus Pacearchaeota archaeon]
MKRALQIVSMTIMRAILLIMVLFLIYQQDFLFAISATVALLISLTPIYLKRKYKIDFPWLLEFLVIVILLLHLFGENFGLFVKIRFYSPMMHFFGTAIIAFFAYMTIYLLNCAGKIDLPRYLLVIFVIAFALGLGAVWEIGEFASDKYLGTTDQGDGIDPLDDTMYDLIFDGIAGLFIAIIGEASVRSKQFLHFSKQIIRKLGKVKSKMVK